MQVTIWSQYKEADGAIKDKRKIKFFKKSKLKYLKGGKK
jgi:hypothetical protein